MLLQVDMSRVLIFHNLFCKFWILLLYLSKNIGMNFIFDADSNHIEI